MNTKYVETYINNIPSDLPNIINWEEREDAPRKEIFMANEELSYTYGMGRGIRTYDSVPMIPFVKDVMDKINSDYNYNLDICFLNYYKNEKMWLGWHSDDSPEIDQTEPIAVVSIGAERDIWVKTKDYKGVIPDEWRFNLKSGSLFMMLAGFQDNHLHKIPKWDKKCDWRISLTFRKYKKI